MKKDQPKSISYQQWKKLRQEGKIPPNTTPTGDSIGMDQLGG